MQGHPREPVSTLDRHYLLPSPILYFSPFSRRRCSNAGRGDGADGSKRRASSCWKSAETERKEPGQSLRGGLSLLYSLLAAAVARPTSGADVYYAGSASFRWQAASPAPRRGMICINSKGFECFLPAAPSTVYLGIIRSSRSLWIEECNVIF